MTIDMCNQNSELQVAVELLIWRVRRATATMKGNLQAWRMRPRRPQSLLQASLRGQKSQRTQTNHRIQPNHHFQSLLHLLSSERKSIVAVRLVKGSVRY